MAFYKLALWRPHPRAVYLPGIVVTIVATEGPHRVRIRWREPGTLIYSEDDPVTPTDMRRGCHTPRQDPVMLIRERVIPRKELANVPGNYRTRRAS